MVYELSWSLAVVEIRNDLQHRFLQLFDCQSSCEFSVRHVLCNVVQSLVSCLSETYAVCNVVQLLVSCYSETYAEELQLISDPRLLLKLINNML